MTLLLILILAAIALVGIIAIFAYYAFMAMLFVGGIVWAVWGGLLAVILMSLMENKYDAIMFGAIGGLPAAIATFALIAKLRD